MITALVLAAGESRRMGLPKPLLRFGSQPTTFLERIVEGLQSSDVDRMTVVLGCQASRIRATVSLAATDVIVNPAYRQGQLSSLLAGLRTMPADTEAIVLCLVDQPLITTEIVNQVITAYRKTRRPIIIPTFQGRRGHPALFARPVFEELLAAPAQEGARHVVHANTERVLELAVSDSAVVTSIDTPDDYRAHFGMAPTLWNRHGAQ